MNIGFIATRIAGVDGVSLEIFKIAAVFEAMGHHCFYCAGELDSAAQPGQLVPQMHFKHPTAQALYQAAFEDSTISPADRQRIYDEADTIRAALEDFIDRYAIDVLMVQNASCIPMNISLGLAIREVVSRRQICTICQHHDFYWERDRFLSNNIQDILDDAFPPKLTPIKHIVINSAMQRRLRAWRGIEAYLLPNIFDYETPAPQPDDYANTFRQAFDIGPNDLIVLQPTRIIRRKAIEKAIELVRKLDDPRLVFVVTGYEGDEPGQYGAWLREEADRAGIRYRFIGDYVGAERGMHAGKPVFSLWDIYPHAHFVTYPSTYEGFGNALLETVYFRKPFIVHRYGPYVADIKPTGIRAVEFSHDINADVLAQVRHLLDDDTYRADVVEHNYQVALQHFSYAILRDTLQRILDDISTSKNC